jgi:Flp pilus assembly protein TadB
VNESDHPAPAPPPGEELHIPGPSLLPFLCAIAITLVVIGTTISIVISIVGLVALVIIVWRWISDTRREVAELPESHH